MDRHGEGRELWFHFFFCKFFFISQFFLFESRQQKKGTKEEEKEGNARSCNTKEWRRFSFVFVCFVFFFWFCLVFLPSFFFYRVFFSVPPVSGSLPFQPSPRLPSFTEFYRVLPSFTQLFQSSFTELQRIEFSMTFSEFYWVLPGFSIRALLRFSGLSFDDFNLVLSI